MGRTTANAISQIRPAKKVSATAFLSTLARAACWARIASMGTVLSSRPKPLSVVTGITFRVLTPGGEEWLDLLRLEALFDGVAARGMREDTGDGPINVHAVSTFRQLVIVCGDGGFVTGSRLFAASLDEDGGFHVPGKNLIAVVLDVIAGEGGVEPFDFAIHTLLDVGGEFDDIVEVLRPVVDVVLPPVRVGEHAGNPVSGEDVADGLVDLGGRDFPVLVGVGRPLPDLDREQLAVRQPRRDQSGGVAVLGTVEAERDEVFGPQRQLVRAGQHIPHDRVDEDRLTDDDLVEEEPPPDELPLR